MRAATAWCTRTRGATAIPLATRGATRCATSARSALATSSASIRWVRTANAASRKPPVSRVASLARRTRRARPAGATRCRADATLPVSVRRSHVAPAESSASSGWKRDGRRARASETRSTNVSIHARARAIVPMCGVHARRQFRRDCEPQRHLPHAARSGVPGSTPLGASCDTLFGCDENTCIDDRCTRVCEVDTDCAAPLPHCVLRDFGTEVAFGVHTARVCAE